MRREVRCSGCEREFLTEDAYEKHSCGWLACREHPDRRVQIFGKCRAAWCPCGKPLSGLSEAP